MEVESEVVDLTGKTVEILVECKKQGEVLSKQTPPLIYMVPSVIRDLSPNSFTPRVVAIGPLHRQDEHLQAFEVQKLAYLHNWLHELGKEPEQIFRECAEEVIRSIEKLKACYEGSIIYCDFELAKMMVIDACFILEFIQRLPQSLSSGRNILVTGSIVQDLLLIENQIPFFVLEIIFKCTLAQSKRLRVGTSLTTHIQVLLKFFHHFEGIFVVPRAYNPDHILGFLHAYFRPAERTPKVSTQSSRKRHSAVELDREGMKFKSSRKRHSAVELDRAGMKFKPNTEDQNWVLAMKLEFPLPLFPWFNIFMAIPPISWFRRPTLRMPKVQIHDGSELIFRNLVVYEQSPDVENYVTSYLFALDYLIDTPEDVALLVKSKVVHSEFGSNEEAADMINMLCKNIAVKFYYNQQWEKMDAYYNSYWPHFIAELKRTYFNNPWSIVALIAAFLLFALTATQTIFTVKSANN